MVWIGYYEQLKAQRLDRPPLLPAGVSVKVFSSTGEARACVDVFQANVLTNLESDLLYAIGEKNCTLRSVIAA